MQAFYNGTIFDGKNFITDAAVLTDQGRIAGVVNETAIPPHAERINLQHHYIAPAFMDLQIYGGYGKLFSQDLSIEALQKTYEYCISGGCAQFMITLATNSLDIFIKGAEVVSQYWRQGGKGLLGLHLEGPYINPVKRGAHIERCIRRPFVEEVKDLLGRTGGAVKMMTLAPEVCSQDVIQLLQQYGIIISAGHSNATYRQGMQAFNTGIPAATHLFNAMSPLQHREPGLVGAIYDHDTVKSSIVADGIHVDFAALRISKKILGERLFLITDAVAATDAGEYQHVFSENRYKLPDGTLSGSALTMMLAVKNCVAHAGITLEEALRMASLYPARLIQHDNVFGKIEKDYAAAFVVFNDNFDVVETVI